MIYYSCPLYSTIVIVRTPNSANRCHSISSKTRGTSLRLFSCSLRRTFISEHFHHQYHIIIMYTSYIHYYNSVSYRGSNKNWPAYSLIVVQSQFGNKRKALFCGGNPSFFGIFCSDSTVLLNMTDGVASRRMTLEILAENVDRETTQEMRNVKWKENRSVQSSAGAPDSLIPAKWKPCSLNAESNLLRPHDNQE